MNNEIIIGLMSMCGTIIGTLGGIMTSAKLTAYRIQELEKKVEKHNNFAMRIPVLEEQVKDIKEELKNA